MDTPRSAVQPVWWLRPHLVLALFVLPIYLLLGLSDVSPRFGRYYVTTEYLLLGVAFLSVMTLASYLSAQFVPRKRIDEFYISPRCMDLLAIVVMAAYVIWFWRLAIHPELLRNVIAGAAMYVRGEISTIPGLTTLSQLGIVYGTLWSLGKWHWHQPMPRRFDVYLYVIIVLTIVRTIAWGERLASVEIIIPIAVIYVLRWQPGRRISRGLLISAPFILVGALFLFFSGTEAFRSWDRQQFGVESLWSYMWSRFTYYYFSAVNNGCGLLQEYPWPGWDMQFTFRWVYAIPGIGGVLTDYVKPADAAMSFLQFQGDSEFTTFTGIFSVFYDGGVVFGLMVALILGSLMGVSYRYAIAGYAGALMAYPLLYIHLLEMLRLFYIGESRAVPVWLGLVIILATRSVRGLQRDVVT